MPILRIEHKILHYDGWKKAFDKDPINREKAGVKRYQIYRPVDDPNFVMVDLYFDTMEATHATLEALKKLWHQVQGTVIIDPQTRILNLEETVEL